MNWKHHPQDTRGCASVPRREASCARGSDDSRGAQQASKPHPACLGTPAFPFLRRKQAFCLQGRSKERDKRHVLHPQKYPSQHPHSPWPPRPSLSHLGAHPRSPPHPTQALWAERSSRSSFSRFEALRALSCVTFTRHCLSLQFLYPIVCRFALFYCKIHLPPIPLIADTRRVTSS